MSYLVFYVRYLNSLCGHATNKFMCCTLGAILLLGVTPASANRIAQRQLPAGISQPKSPHTQHTTTVAGIEMIQIPTGSFLMGIQQSQKSKKTINRHLVKDVSFSDILDQELKHPDARLVHRVRVHAFLLGAYEVTEAQWQKVMGANPSYLKIKTHPVEQVSWNNVQIFIRKLNRQEGENFRLPSEAEWEYAARAGSHTRYSWGDKIGHNLANCDGCGSVWDNVSTAPVGSFTANGFGLYDMHGNVREWVMDTNQGTYQDAPADGSAWETIDSLFRINRGGSYREKPYLVRSASRGMDPSMMRSPEIGFRLAKDL